MGRQIGFFMLPKDEEEFFVHLREAGAFLARTRSTKPTPITIDHFPPQGTPEARLGTVLWRPDLAPLIFKELGPSSFIIDKANSDVIEFGQSYLENGVL